MRAAWGGTCCGVGLAEVRMRMAEVRVLRAVEARQALLPCHSLPLSEGRVEGKSKGRSKSKSESESIHIWQIVSAVAVKATQAQELLLLLLLLLLHEQTAVVVALVPSRRHGMVHCGLALCRR